MMSLRRLAGFLVALSVAMAPTALWPAGASASGGTLFAITGQADPTLQAVLSRIDPATGTVTTVNPDLGGPNHGQVGTITGDPATHRIFGVRSSAFLDDNGNFVVTNEVLTIDSQTGALLTTSPDIAKPVDQIAFDSISGVLYLMSFNATYRLNPTTGATTLVANLPDLGPTIMSMAVPPGGNTLLINVEDASGGTSDEILSVNTTSGAITTSPQLAQMVRVVAYDPATGGLLGATECCPRQLLRIDSGTGAETAVGPFNNASDQTLQFAMAVDASTNTDFMTMLVPSNNFQTVQSQIVSMNDQSGATAVSPLINDVVWSEYFEPPAVTISADSVKADVRAALANGGITTAGVANALLADLNAAAAARSRGQCSVAANDFRAFISQVNAQTGKAVSPAMANALIADAQYLIAHCP